MSQAYDRWVEGKDLEAILQEIGGTAEPGSIVFEIQKAAIEVRVAEMQRDAARDALRWARLAAISTTTATVIAVVALLVSLFS